MRSEHPMPDSEAISRPQSAPDSLVIEGRSFDPTGGGEPWRVFVALGLIGGAFCWLFWSIWMSVWLRHDLISILVGPGAAFGLFSGASFGVMMAIVMRPGTVTLPVTNRDDFLSRLDGEMAKLRYRPLNRADGLRLYEPRTLLRPPAFRILVRLGDGEATAAGPTANIKALKKRLRR